MLSSLSPLIKPLQSFFTCSSTTSQAYLFKMPIHALILASRLPHLSPADFKLYMEERHIPLLQSMAGDNFPTEHKRSYIARDAQAQAILFAGKPEDINFDVVADLSFQDEAHLQRYQAATIGGPRAAEVHEDEAKFIELQTLRIVSLESTNVTRGAA